MTTAVAARWSALGGLSSGVGLPLETPDQSCVATACAQRFENAVATWSMAQPAQMMSGEIAKLWLKSGGLDSGMGIALATLGPCDGTVGCVQLLTNGAITWSWRTGAQTVVGAFLEMWQGRGGIGSDLGLPTGSPPLRCDGFVGCVQDFSGGAATWSWAEGAQAIVGPIAGAKVAESAKSARPAGCFAFGNDVMMMVKAIGISTPPLKPWMARSTIICPRFCAAAQAAEKARNRTALLSR